VHFILYAIMTLIIAAASSGADTINPPAGPWVPDQGDGTYKNPVLFADYSDPDVIRVGDDFYLTSSSFLSAPGLPVLHSKDLVNWTIINHVFAEQQPAGFFSKPRHGQGVWAPAIRHHAGKFWITYPDPDFGIYLTTATDPGGAWTAPQLILPGKGLIDPCPFWDDDGRFYLVHGWAKSRAAISNRITLRELSPDGARTLGNGEIIIDGDKIPDWHTLEGPKLYKRNGYYYVFAPSGGVVNGYQAVFRAKNIHGPYEHRIVLAQGRTPINGPHQGAWVDTPSGEDWFLHFQDRGPFGRVVHLQPMVWHDDWPKMGADAGNGGPGAPVLTHRKPDVGRTWPISVPRTSDEFDAPSLGLQWQWNANPRSGWFSLSARQGFLRLRSVPAPAARNDGSAAVKNLYDAPNFLLQKFPAPAFAVTTALEFFPAATGETAGLVVYGYAYALLGLRSTATGRRLVLLVNNAANEPGAEEREAAGVDLAEGPVMLRATVDAQAACRFYYSVDQKTFHPVGGTFQASADRWVGARFGLIATAATDAISTGHADFDWFRVTPFSSPTPAGQSAATLSTAAQP
jgi:beta-xylosidase